ncbi:MAG: 4-hydroxyphenylpyruvate dioxygenase [Candidatus Marinimicrobia bacterium]|jgi:4-hydroxyphenylpyruvate dioxygenase|nr:4-hydroxyphenylpyruvate dioxygenase [Candidatus Neomarinimicrobiota bacterium]
MNDAPYSIKGFDHCELYVGNAKQTAYYYNTTMGFKTVAYRGLETGCRDRVSYVLNQGHIFLVVTSPLEKNTEIGDHIDRHGDGIKDVAFTVDNAEEAWSASLGRGAKSALEPTEIKDGNGEAVISSIHTFGDTIHTFIERNNYKGSFLPGYKVHQPKIDSEMLGLIHIDHIVGNQPDGEMQTICDFYEKVFGWHRFWTVDDKDITTEYSSLRSIVMANENEIVKMPINEPAEGLKKSQIQEFIDYYETAGVQHLALSTKDIIHSVEIMRNNGVEFLPTPDSYYDNLIDRVGEIDEDIEKLKKFGILVDNDENGYMLQIFTKPLQDRPTLFFEIIQRKGSNSFGKGNFKALFESIEREQEKRGNL